MGERGFRRLDGASLVLLLLWLGMALGAAALVAPALFGALDRPVAGAVAGRIFFRLDLAAWVAFGGSFLLSGAGRWFHEVGDGDVPIGPLRLWNGAALAALLVCMASSLVVLPRVEEHRQALLLRPEDQDLRARFRKAHSVSTQMLVIRMLLAAGLAAGVLVLPRRKPEVPEARGNEATGDQA